MADWLYLFFPFPSSFSSLGLFILRRCVKFGSIFLHQSINGLFDKLISPLCFLIENLFFFIISFIHLRRLPIQEKN